MQCKPDLLIFPKFEWEQKNGKVRTTTRKINFTLNILKPISANLKWAASVHVFFNIL